MQGEVVVYKVKSGKLAEFKQMHANILHEYQLVCPGLTYSKTLRAEADDHTFVDIWDWGDAAAARSAKSAFKNLPSAKLFMNCIEGVIWSGLVSDEL